MYKCYFGLGFFVGVIVLVFVDDFVIVWEEIDKVKFNINYKIFCVEMFEGEDKIVCCMKSVFSVGFFVC